MAEIGLKGTPRMIKIGTRRLLSGIAVAALAAAAGLMSSGSASADAITATTTCTNPYTGAQAGPSSFDVEIPAMALVGGAVNVLPRESRPHLPSRRGPPGGAGAFSRWRQRPG